MIDIEELGPWPYRVTNDGYNVHRIRYHLTVIFAKDAAAEFGLMKISGRR